MATSLVRYLINEGSGTVLADSAGSGYDMAWSPGNNGSWSLAMANGTSIAASSVTGTAIAQNAAYPSALLANATNLTMVAAVQNMEGTNSMLRFLAHGGSDGSAYTMTLGFSSMQVRWRAEANWDNGTTYRWSNFAPVGGMTANMVIIIDSDMSRAAGDRHRMYLNNNLVATSSIDNDAGQSLTNMSGYSGSLLNRASGGRGAAGNIGYFEVLSGSLTAQERADCTTNLLVDCDADWQGGGPPTSVSFTSEPSATNIDTDRVTATATAESDAP